MVTVFLSILNLMEFHLVQNRKENCHQHLIPFNLKGNGNIVFSVYTPARKKKAFFCHISINFFYIQTRKKKVFSVIFTFIFFTSRPERRRFFSVIFFGFLLSYFHECFIRQGLGGKYWSALALEKTTSPFCIMGA